jgi:WD40 repeat protein
LLSPLSKGGGGGEIAVMQAVESKNPITGICYQDQTNSLFTVDSKDGILMRWDVDSGDIETSSDINIHSFSTLQFIEDCNKLFGAKQVEFRSGRANIVVEYIDDVHLWDTLTSEVIRCWGRCDEDVQGDPIQIGAIIDESGEKRIDYYDSGYSLTEGFLLSKSVFVRGIEETSPTVGQIVFSPSSTKFVIAYLEGGIRINDNRWIKKNSSNDKHKVVELVIDPTEKYIARIQDHYLTVWKVGVFSKQEIVHTKLGEENQIIFDKSGQFMFVGGQGHIQIWDMTQNQMIHEVLAKGISSMTISDDNRLLVWGDEYGNIHFWGLKESEE